MTHNEIEGGIAGDHASTLELTNSTIHQQLDVDVVFDEALEDLNGPKKSSTSLALQEP